MSAVTPLPLPADPRGPLMRGVALVKRTWARRSWYFAAAVGAFCVAAPFMSAGYVALLFSPKHVGNTPGQIVADVVNATVLMLVLSLADTAVEEGARLRRTYAVGLVVGALVAALLQWEMLEALDIRTFMRRANMLSPAYQRTQICFVMASNLMVGGMLLWIHVQWREARRSAQARHRGEHERLALAQQAETARLLALQSRIEPQWLFDVMGHVRALWRREPHAGAALLDETIITLRHAMPPRTMQSTLARECALLDGQLRLRSVLHPGVSPALHTDIPPELAHARLAPLVLWPLMQWLVDVQPAATTWRLSAEELRAANGKPRLALRLHSAHARWPAGDAVLTVLRTRLAGVHGANATLNTLPESDGVAVELEVALKQVDNRDAERADR